MKKFLFVLMGLLISSPTWAGCSLIACGDTNLFDPNGLVTADVGHNQCWFCGPGPNSCSNHDVVPYWDGVGDVVSLYQCSYGFSNTFEKFHPGRFCDNSPLKSDAGLKGVDTVNAKVTYSLVGRDITPIKLGHWNVFDGQEACIFVKCKESFVPNANKTACVKPEENCSASQVYENGGCVEKKSGCEESGGGWRSGDKECTCEPTKNIKNKDVYSCTCESGYSWKADRRDGCYNAAAVSAKDKCEKSGGQYQNGACKCDVAKHLQTSNGACICESDDYVRDSSGKACKLKPGIITQDMCNKIPEAEWRINTCFCKDDNKIIENMRCVAPRGYEECIAAKGKVGDPYWDGNECQCRDTNYKWSINTCVETDEYVADQSARRINDLAADIDKTISATGGDLKVWRNVDGSFNTARLASDSIAGVVLGTVGGVVTSSIIKKNQVADGFEDIKCAIGGQSVASYGDQFSVGLQ